MKNSATKKKRKHSFIKSFFIFILLMVVLAIVGSVALFAYYYPKVPPLNTALFEYSQNAVIYDRNEQPYQNLQGEENRQTLLSEQIPDTVKNAFIAIEDKRFYQHNGVDLLGIMRAIKEVVSNQNLNGSGGSTITQQLIKLTHLTSEKTIERKFDEWVLAIELEQIYPKDKILTDYLNKVNFHGSEGIQAAAQQYFGVDVPNLTLGQIAILAAVPNSPSYFDPYTYDEQTGDIIRDANNNIVLNPNNCTRALNVINEMQDQGYITAEDADAARIQIKESPGLVNNNPYRTYSYFTDAVYMSLLVDIQDALNMTENEAVDYINTTGLKIYSTVDPNVQNSLEEAVHNDSLFPVQNENAAYVSESTGTEYIPEVGTTIINNEDGSVLAMVGGREEKTSLSLNRATTPFQVGSSIKPLTTYAPAIEENIVTLNSNYIDQPVNIEGWEPKNSSNSYIGNTTVRNAIKDSINTVAVQVCDDLGINTSADYAKKLGLTIENDDYNLAALALGGFVTGQTSEQMASAFSTIARGGEYIKPYLYYEVQDDNGTILVTHKEEKTKVFSPETCYDITEALRDASHGGTTTLNIAGSDVVGKTGTTDNQVNAWFCGYSPTYSMAVWYGYDANSVDVDGINYPLNIGIFGGDKPGPAALFENVMGSLETQTTLKNFTKPIIEENNNDNKSSSDNKSSNNSSNKNDSSNSSDSENSNSNNSNNSNQTDEFDEPNRSTSNTNINRSRSSLNQSSSSSSNAETE